MSAEAKTYTALYPVRRNGETYQPGSRLSLTDAQATPLLDRKLIAVSATVQPDNALQEKTDHETGRKASAKKAKA